MLNCFYHGFATAIAWWISLRFLRIRPQRVAWQALGTGALCGFASFFLHKSVPSGWIYGIEAGIFLLSGFVVPFRTESGVCGALIAFLLAQSAFILGALPAGSAWPELGAAAAMLFVISGVVCRLSRKYPDWTREEAHKTARSEKHLLVWAAMLCAVFAVATYLAGGMDIIGRWLVTLLCALLYCTGLWLVSLMCAYDEERKTVETEQQYRDEMRSFLNVIRSQRHDYNFHVQTISGLIRQGKIDDCLNYMEALEEDTSLMNAILPVRDPAVSAMIYAFRLQAVRQGIELNVDIRYDMSQIATNVYETNKIISNLLQNAIDEVSGQSDKSFGIELVILKRGEYCVIRVSNKVRRLPSPEEMDTIFRQGYTTKKGHDGVGLSSLKTLAARYHGTVYSQLDGEVISFVAKIPIDYAKEPLAEEG